MALSTFSIVKREKLEDSRQILNVSLALGDGAATYPAGGIDIPLSQLGLRMSVDAVSIMGDAASTRMVKYDRANRKLRIYVEGASVYAEMSGIVPAITLDLLVIGA